MSYEQTPNIDERTRRLMNISAVGAKKAPALQKMITEPRLHYIISILSLVAEIIRKHTEVNYG